MRLIPNQPQVTTPATYESTRESGFAENWNAALGLAMSEDLPVLSRVLPTVVSSQRSKKISDYINSGDIPQAAAAFYGSDHSGMALYARDTLGLDGFVTDEDYQEQRELEYKGRRDYSQSVFEKASKMGFVGQMAGAMHAMALDPIYATSLLTGYGSAATMGQAALRMGLMEAGIEAVAQIPKMSFKEDIDSDYSGAEAVTQVAFAGVGAAALTVIAKGLGRLVSPKDLTVGHATEALVRMEKDNPELTPIINTLKNADPEDNLAKLLEADEAIDIRRANESPMKTDEKSRSTLKAEEHFSREEEVYLKRNPQPEPEAEGVPRGTPKEEVKPEPDLRHPMVKEADHLVEQRTTAIQLMEECF